MLIISRFVNTIATISPAVQSAARRASFRFLLMRFSLLPLYCLPGRLGCIVYWLRIRSTAFSALLDALTIRRLSSCRALSQFCT